MRSTKKSSASATSSSRIAMSRSGSVVPIPSSTSRRRLLHDRRARVVVLVDAVAEAHQLDAGLLVLDPLHERVDVAAVVVDALEHLEHCLVGAAVQRAEESVDTGGDRGEQVGVARADHAHGRRWSSSARGRRAARTACPGRAPWSGPPRTARPARRTSCAGSSRRSPGSCRGRAAAGRPTSCRRRRRSSAAWPSAARSRSRRARGRTGRGCPGRTSTAR